MQHAKTGLKLLSFSLFVTIGWAIATFIIGIISAIPDSKINIDTALVASCISVVCYVIELIGLHIAGKDSKYFHRASFLKIASLVLAIVCVILGAVSKNMSADAQQVIVTIFNVVNIIIAVADVIALISVVKGCKEIAPRVKGQANLILVCFIIMALASIVVSFLDASKVEGNDGLVIFVLLLALAASIASLIYAINYIILIFRTTKQVGKPR